MTLLRFEQAVLPHLDAAHNLARWLLRDVHDAEDVTQQACLRAFDRFDRFRGGDARAWLLAIVRNCCMTWLRQHRGERNTLSFDAGGVSLADSRETDARAIQRSERAVLARALDTLPDEFREVIVLREIQELSYKEISDVVGVPIGTVMSRLARGRKRLASALGLGVKEAS